MSVESKLSSPFVPLAWVALAVVAGLIALVPRALPSPAEASLSADAALRAYGVDLLWPEAIPPARVEPPWTIGTPSGASRLFTRRVSARPSGAFTLQGREGAWRAWNVLGAESAGSSDTEDFVAAERLREARVSIVNAEGVERVCEAWLFGRWYCGPDPWNYVGMTRLSVRGRETECIWAHPSEEGTLRIAFDEVPLRRSLVGTTYLSDAAASGDIDGEVRWSVSVEGETLVERTQHHRRGGMVARSDIGRALREARPDAPLPAEAEVVFEVSASAFAQQHFCFVATLRGAFEEDE